jgi:hypothetical protein
VSIRVHPCPSVFICGFNYSLDAITPAGVEENLLPLAKACRDELTRERVRDRGPGGVYVGR